MSNINKTKMCLLSYVRNFLCIIFLILGFTDISQSSLPDGFACFQRGPCSCAGNNGELLDLSPLASSAEPLIAATTTSLYIYHPCTDTPLHAVRDNDCNKNYGLCYFKPKTPTEKPLDLQKVLSNTTFGNFTKIGINDEAVIRVNQFNKIEIVYKHAINATTTIATYVILDCNEKIDNYKLTIDKTTPSENFLTLTSHYACIQREHHLSGAAVFFIILIIFASLYFIGGVLVLKFIRGAKGIEMIPNHEFWCKLPQLAKDGVVYLTSCGRSTPDSYEKI